MVIRGTAILVGTQGITDAPDITVLCCDYRGEQASLGTNLRCTFDQKLNRDSLHHTNGIISNKFTLNKV